MEQACVGPQTKQMQGCSDHLCNPDTTDPKTMVCFEEIVSKNYMKLLDLDDAAEEECYRMAAERPISPTLPEMKFSGKKSFEVNDIRPVHDECERFSHENGNLASSDKFDVPKCKENGFCSTFPAERAFLSCSQVPGVNVEMSIAPGSVDEVANIPSESDFRSTIEIIPKYCFMFSSMKDDSTVSRIFCATKTCMIRCTLRAQTEFVVHRILHALKSEEELLPKEKVCVFLSLVLLNFCTTTSKNGSLCRDLIPCLNLFAEHINEVISDSEARSVVAQLCSDELLSLIGSCPFSEDALSVDTVVLSIFTKLRNYAHSGTMHQSLSANTSNSSVTSLEDMNVSCCLDTCVLASKQLGSVVTETVCDVSDAFSLLELLACNMRWNWTCQNIISQLWSMLESSVLNNLTFSIIILLGQLGRIVVDAVGYEDKEVENLRVKLSAYLWRESTIKASSLQPLLLCSGLYPLILRTSSFLSSQINVLWKMFNESGFLC